MLFDAERNFEEQTSIKPISLIPYLYVLVTLIKCTCFSHSKGYV